MTTTADRIAEGLATEVWPGTFRAYQLDALNRLDECRRNGRRRAWLVLPPGAGKTLVGLEAARRRGGRIVVFVPTTAIQGQWVRTWRQFTPRRVTAGTDRDLRHGVTVLTYQSLAVFDSDASGSGVSDHDVDPQDDHTTAADTGRDRPLLSFLHANGRALIEALRSAGPVTVILDECHHLLETWGRVVADLLDELSGADVIGLTATPPDSLTAAQAALVERLFGTPVRGAGLPAVVRAGYLAPFAELAFLTAPTPVEAEYIRAEAERFAEFRSDLIDPGFAASPFLSWCDARFVAREEAAGAGNATGDGTGTLAVSWNQLEREAQPLARAALRLHHAGLLELPPGARLREEHRTPPTADDWVALLDDYVTGCLGRSADPRDQTAVDAIRAALPSIGYRLTRRGIRASQSPVDRVLARSDAKTGAAVEITAAEAAELGERLRALVLCDFESASATLPARLVDVLDAQAGGAWLTLGKLAEDPRTAALDPLMVTGRTVAAGVETAAAFAAWASARMPGLDLAAEPDRGGVVARITGAWSPRDWVPLVTEYFQSGLCRVLVGTRALLGEGWDAHTVNAVVDLTSATTAGAVVQLRGRGLRLDPSWPDKTSNNWTVVCATDTHPKGAADWNRFVRKHEGYLAAADTGDIVSGVGHVDPAFSPYAPPAADAFAAVNAAMLRRAGERHRTRERWSIGRPYTDELVHTIRIRAPRRTSSRLPDRPPGRPLPLPAPAGLAASNLQRLTLWFAINRAVRLLADAAGPPPVSTFAYTVAEAMRDCGLSEVGADAVRSAAEPDGTYRIELAGVSTAVSLKFTRALDELVSPIDEPRWFIPRYELPPLPEVPRARRAAARAWLRGRAPANTVVYHPVPALFARPARRLDIFAGHWRRWISPGTPIATGSPEGEGVLVTHRGRSPLDATTALRVAWH
ncbi:MAG TPA: DEAD/DEAH box helicase family protein [Thermoleophilia bacterium]|nr:DEAD/DEAH box helicase family protein [Thermoleophilia bacterium]